jgi:hypothetical protein
MNEQPESIPEQQKLVNYLEEAYGVNEEIRIEYVGQRKLFFLNTNSQGREVSIACTESLWANVLSSHRYLKGATLQDLLTSKIIGKEDDVITQRSIAVLSEIISLTISEYDYMRATIYHQLLDENKLVITDMKLLVKPLFKVINTNSDPYSSIWGNTIPTLYDKFNENSSFLPKVDIAFFAYQDSKEDEPALVLQRGIKPIFE